MEMDDFTQVCLISSACGREMAFIPVLLVQLIYIAPEGGLVFEAFGLIFVHIMRNRQESVDDLCIVFIPVPASR